MFCPVPMEMFANKKKIKKDVELIQSIWLILCNKIVKIKTSKKQLIRNKVYEDFSDFCSLKLEI